MTSVCIESTLDVYRNDFTCVSKRQDSFFCKRVIFHTPRYTFSYLFDKHFHLFSLDNLFVSTWSQMEMITKVDVSESSQFVSETT